MKTNKPKAPISLIVGHSLNYITATDAEIKRRSLKALLAIIESQPERGRRPEFMLAALKENESAARLNLPLWHVYYSLFYDALKSDRNGTLSGHIEAVICCLNELAAQFYNHAELILMKAHANIGRSLTE
jgi:hypothetical protein